VGRATTRPISDVDQEGRRLSMRDPSKPQQMTAEEEAEFEESRLTPEQKQLGDQLREEQGVIEVKLIDGWFVFIRPWRDAVAEAWERILRARVPGTTWEVRASGKGSERAARDRS
jgi:hypothetical protein